jgi:hypothetical protein
MQGSLDLPPIVIRSSRRQAAVFLLLSVGFVATGVFMLRDPKANPVIGYLVAGFFGLGISVFGYRFIKPDVLTLAPDGIIWRSMFRAARWRWDEVRDFRPYKPPGRGVTKHIGFDFTDSHSGSGAGLRGAAKTLTGVEGSLGTGWELGTADLTDLLNKAQARWQRRA